MALNSTTLAALIVTKVEGQFGEVQPRGLPGLEKMAAAIAQAVVEHIKANAEVRITVTDSGLQRDPASSTDTLAPLTQKTLSVT